MKILMIKIIILYYKNTRDKMFENFCVKLTIISRNISRNMLCRHLNQDVFILRNIKNCQVFLNKVIKAQLYISSNFILIFACDYLYRIVYIVDF